MAETRYRAEKAYDNREFMNSRQARSLRIQAEYVEPETRFEKFGVQDTIVFFGSARFKSKRQAQTALKAARQSGVDVEAAEKALAMSRYYEDARALANKLTLWSKDLDAGDDRRFVVCTGGGPGIMEAANRGASEAKGLNIGLNISIPDEQHDNPYITRHLSFEFHYFFMRKFWFVYMAKAIIVFPGGFGTLDELMEVVTLKQTGKLTRPIKIVLYGADYWQKVIDFGALAEFGTINKADIDLMTVTDSVDEAFENITEYLADRALHEPGGAL